jgi:hypothetical protein
MDKANFLTPDDLDEDEREAFEERAALMQYQGGMSREAAEAKALERIEKARLTQGQLF